MGMSPSKMEFLAAELRKVFDELEIVLLSKIAKRLNSGLEYPDWRERKLAEVQKLKKEVDDIVRRYVKTNPKLIEEIIQKAYESGVEAATEDFKEAGRAITGSVTAQSMVAMNTLRVTEYIAQAQNLVKDATFRILRETEDKYRQVISESAIISITGVETKLQSVQRALNKFADAGITGFTDKAGRRWELSAYTDMAVRTAIGQSAMAGHMQRISDLGEDLLIVSEHPEECPICRPWEGKILSISGFDPRYPSVAFARASGLFHPNCGHVATAYFEGYTEPIKPNHSAANAKAYEEKQQQRYIERQIRRWKRREAVALSPTEQEYAQKKVKEWQLSMKTFISDTGRRRKPERERVNFGVK